MKLKESQLKKIIRESVKKYLNEENVVTYQHSFGMDGIVSYGKDSNGWFVYNKRNGAVQRFGSEEEARLAGEKLYKQEGQRESQRRRDFDIQCALDESISDDNVIKSRMSVNPDKYPYVVYGEDNAMTDVPYFAANYLRKVFRRFPTMARAKKFAEELYELEVERRREEMKGVIMPDDDEPLSEGVQLSQQMVSDAMNYLKNPHLSASTRKQYVNWLESNGVRVPSNLKSVPQPQQQPRRQQYYGGFSNNTPINLRREMGFYGPESHRMEESKLSQIVKESIKKVLKEDDMEKIRQSRYDGLVEIVEYYLSLEAEKGDSFTLSPEQREQLMDTCKQLCVFGQNGVSWAKMGLELLGDEGQEIIDLYKDLPEPIMENITIRDVIQRYNNEQDMCKDLIEFAGLEATPEFIKRIDGATALIVSALRKIFNASDSSKQKIARQELMRILQRH